MTFKSTIDKWSDLPIEGVKIGDTYAVSGSDTIIENDVFYYPGDLLIATGKETDGIITEGLVWEHIKTGYTGVYESRLVGEDNKITLKNYGDDSLGDIDFQTDGNISVSVSKNTVSIGLEKISYDIDDNTIIIE